MKFVQQFPIAGQKGGTSFQSENCWFCYDEYAQSALIYYCWINLGRKPMKFVQQ